MVLRLCAAICGAAILFVCSSSAMAKLGTVGKSTAASRHEACAMGVTIVGTASMYDPFQPGYREGGAKTASGELYDPIGWTAAIQTDLRETFGGVRHGKDYRPAYDKHAHDDVGRCAELIGLMHDKQRQRRSYHVANNGKEPDQPIKAEAYARAGDDERGVEQGRKRVNPRDAGATRARSRKVEAIGGGHWSVLGAQMGMRDGERKRPTAASHWHDEFMGNGYSRTFVNSKISG